MLKPKRTINSFIDIIRNIKLQYLILAAFSLYILFNFLFALLYKNFTQITESCIKVTLFDSFYFSIVTGSTLGYGDYSPQDSLGKILVIFHVVFISMYFATFISVLAVKILYPKDSIIFSNKMVYNKKMKLLFFRIINVNKGQIINPDIRIISIDHTTAHGTSSIRNIGEINQLSLLENYDIKLIIPKETSAHILKQKEIAMKYNQQHPNEKKSRFKIVLSFVGISGFSNYTCIKEYFENDIVYGNDFENICYPDNFITKGKYSKIDNFWEKFNNTI